MNLDVGISRASAAGAARQVCTDRYDELLPNSGDAYRLLLSEALPTVTEWANGKRTVGCAIQETAAGSAFRNPTFVNLPSNFQTLVSSFVASPGKYQMCVDDPGTDGNSGPQLGDAAIIADCATGQWTLEPSPDIPEDPTQPYPSYNELYPFMHSHCGALYDTATVRGWIFYPSAQQWASGSRSFQCWTGRR